MHWSVALILSLTLSVMIYVLAVLISNRLHKRRQEKMEAAGVRADILAQQLLDQLKGKGRTDENV